MACNMGEVATVEAWLDSGNHPDDATTFGGTLLVAAAERGGPDIRAFDRVRARYLPTTHGRWYSYESPPGVVQLPPFLFQ